MGQIASEIGDEPKRILFTAVSEMEIHHRRGDLFMTEERLNRVEAGPCFDKMSRN